MVFTLKKMKPTTVLLLFLAGGLFLFAEMSFAAAAPASKYRTAISQASTAYQVQDYATVISLLEPIADKEPQAAFVLGLLAARGQGMERDFKKAAEWWEKSAAKGDAPSQFSLGYLYFKGAVGEMSEENMKKVRKLWKEAAQQDYRDAIFGQALMQKAGIGGEQDMEAAIKNFEKAMLMGHPQAEAELTAARASAP